MGVKTWGNRWELVKALGQGGQGVVYLVRDKLNSSEQNDQGGPVSNPQAVLKLFKSSST